MDLETLRSALLWCFILNYAILLLWFFLLVFARQFVYGLHGKWFRLSPEQFDYIHYFAMAGYKIGILLFNLIPWIALHIVG